MQALTQSQQLLWMGQQLSPLSPLYNMTFLWEWQRPVDPMLFQVAFAELVKHSDAMRTVFPILEQQPRQQVLENLSYEITFQDWSESDKTAASLHAWASERSQQLFNLEECCFDCALIKLADDHWAWFLNQHHLITDAWSITVQYERLLAYYELAEQGQLAQAENMPPFADYVAYATEQSANGAAAAEYWEKLASTLPASSPKFYDFNGLDTRTANERVAIPMGMDRSEQLRLLAAEKDLRSWTVHASIFNILLTSYFAYLYRVSGQRDLAIGTPAHNRVKPAFQQTPGLFIELFPIIVHIAEDETFTSLFQQVRTAVNGFLRYAQPGQSKAAMSRSFGAVLNYIHAGFPKNEAWPMQSRWVHAAHADPQHHLRMQVYDFDQTGEMQLYFDLNDEVFAHDLKSQAPQHFLKILDGFLEDRNQAITAPALTDRDSFVPINPQVEGTPSIATVLDFFAQQLPNSASDIALVDGQRTLTYAELDQRSNQLANQLLATGTGKGQVVAIHCARSIELVIGIWGVLKTGSAYLPIPLDAPSTRVKELIDEAQAQRLLTTQAIAKHAKVAVPVLCLDDASSYNQQSSSAPVIKFDAEDTAYVMFTSGSTGKPKGVVISHGALAHYLAYAKTTYTDSQRQDFALFTRIGFDLTVTSLFTPLLVGGRLVIYPEQAHGPDLAILDVMRDNQVDVVKLTPSHLELIKEDDWQHSRVRCLIVGGEDFKSNLAYRIARAFPQGTAIYNEYGPTEATVGCIVHRFDPLADKQRLSVPIGQSITGMRAYVLDEHLQPVPAHLPGALYLAGNGLADGYWQRPDLTEERFIADPFYVDKQMYATGDLVKINEAGQLEYLGRIDEQIKVAGMRVEPGEIEAQLEQNPHIEAAAVVQWQRPRTATEIEVHYCNRCGLPSNYPNVQYDDEGVCNFCHAFENYEQKARAYFRTLDDLRSVFAQAQSRKTGSYDCMMLLSGGKDSTYALGQLVEMGYKVLAFTLDNGYISQQALDNVQRVADTLGVECVVGRTDAMNDIFVDSLHRHCNVCNGCFKTIYTLATQIAVERGIPIIVTGLSRGQFFETRLTEELFLDTDLDADAIDKIILNARKEYHQVDDAVKRLMDTSIFDDESLFEQVQYVDFYRYTDVSLQEMYKYLDSRVPWARPTDTGRSTNCLINKLGIQVHTQTLGYSNYAFPYSWDVRMGHKQRATAIDEINEPIDLVETEQMMREIGYVPPQQSGKELVAFYVAPTVLSTEELRRQLSMQLPEYMLPSRFQHLEALPLTANGKTDRRQLANRPLQSGTVDVYAPPETELEELLVAQWQELLRIDRIGIHDNFLELGGTSLTAIRLMARLNEMLELDLSLSMVFQNPTIEQLAQRIEDILEELLAP